MCSQVQEGVLKGDCVVNAGTGKGERVQMGASDLDKKGLEKRLPVQDREEPGQLGNRAEPRSKAAGLGSLGRPRGLQGSD